MGKRILVTGSTGFVGACLTHKLVELGYDVHIIKRDMSNTWRISSILNEVVNHDIDLLDIENIDKFIKTVKPDIVFHLAAYAAYPFQQDVLKTINTNLLGTVNLLNTCVKYGFQSFINSGSSSEYGRKQVPMKESDLLEPNSLYGVTKSAATLYCEHVGKSMQLSIATLRLFSVYGYYEEPSRLIPTVAKACITGENPKLSSPYPVRDYIFIEDVIYLYLKLSEIKNLNGVILNAGTGMQHSVGDVVKTCNAITGKYLTPEWGAVPPRTWDTNIWVADISRTIDYLSWQPKYDLYHGLQKTIDWFGENLFFYE